MKKKLLAIVLAAAAMVTMAIPSFAADVKGIYNLTVGERVTARAMDASKNPVEAEEETVGEAKVQVYKKAEIIEVTVTNPSDNYYLVLATKDGTVEDAESNVPNENNLVYIDQQSVGTDSLIFYVYPSKLDDGSFSVFLTSDKSASLGEPVVKFDVGTFSDGQADDFGMLGDVTGDNTIDGRDGLRCMQIVARKIEPDENMKKRADVDGKAGIDGRDALRILQYVAHKIDYSLLQQPAN